MDLKHKIGPLPVWAWGLILGVAGYYFYVRSAGTSTASTANPTASVLDPNAIDPNTGLTYGQEEEAALNANAGAGSLSGTGPSEGNLSSGTSELGDLESFLGQFGNIAQQLGYVPPGGGTTNNGGSVPPANASPTTTVVINSPPIQAGASPPVTTPVVNTNPAVVQSGSWKPAPASTPSIISQVASGKGLTPIQQVNNLIGLGYHKVAGTAQKGGLAQTGTYVQGNNRYFVWGTKATGLQIRKAS